MFVTHGNDGVTTPTAHLDTPDESSDVASRLSPSQDVLLSSQVVAETSQDMAMA
ncbi:MAG TPA: hypothetical protein VF026_22175 [Ktedonobacteraceae bacterium]